MRGDRRGPILIVLALVMVMGLAIYSRLWVIDYQISHDDSEILRRQFDIANRDAMDESAEWRFKYDEEVERASKCAKELIEMKQSWKTQDTASANKKLEMLQKENMDLIERFESLKQELEAEKLKCNAQEI